MQDINYLIDHTNLRITATDEDIRKLCSEAVKYNFRGVCVNPVWVSFVYEFLGRKSIKVISVCDFPLGSSLTELRKKEAAMAIEKGAEEIDLVIQIPLLKSKRYKEVKKDIKEIVNVVHPVGKIKVIIEAPVLSSEEIATAASIVKDAGADFVKSGTGSNGPVTTAQIKQIKSATKLPVKAAGGIKSMQDALELIKAGATILGSSSGKKIMKEFYKIKQKG